MNRICMMFWICVCSISTSAQIEIDHSQLIGTKWQRIEPVVRNVNSYMQFTETCIVDGQERRGRYLVVYYPKVNEVDYYTVMSFTDDELVMFHKAKPETIPGIDVYIKCKRIR